MLELSLTCLSHDAYLVLGMAGARLEIIRTHHICSILYRIGTLCHISPLKLKQGDKNEAEALFKEVNGDSPVALWMEKTIAHIKCTMIYQQSGEREDNKHAILRLHEALNMNTDLVQKTRIQLQLQHHCRILSNCYHVTLSFICLNSQYYHAWIPFSPFLDYPNRLKIPYPPLQYLEVKHASISLLLLKHPICTSITFFLQRCSRTDFINTPFLFLSIPISRCKYNKTLEFIPFLR